MSPAPQTNVMASQETDGYLAASNRIAPSRVIVLDVELELETGEVRARQGLQAQVVEVVVGVVQAEDSEVLGRLEDAGDGQASLGRVMDRGRGGAAKKALDVHVPARIEDVERLNQHSRSLPGWTASCGDRSASRSSVSGFGSSLPNTICGEQRGRHSS
jgi:hypothetical protein